MSQVCAQRMNYTLSSYPPTTRNVLLRCQVTARIPNPGSMSGVNVAIWSPAKDTMHNLYCDRISNRSA